MFWHARIVVGIVDVVAHARDDFAVKQSSPMVSATRVRRHGLGVGGISNGSDNATAAARASRQRPENSFFR